MLAAVYNHLNRLWQGELVRKVSVEGIPDRYGRIRRHGHPVCNSCVRLPDTDLGDLTAQLRGGLFFGNAAAAARIRQNAGSIPCAPAAESVYRERAEI